MIINFRHKGLENFFLKADKSGIKPSHAKRLRLILAKLNTAKDIKDMNFPGADLHLLHGDRKGFWAVKISGNWRVIFRFQEGKILDVDYLDYH